jgi:hypothetical protein
MITDTEIKIKGFHMLIGSLGEIEAQRFISLLLFAARTDWDAETDSKAPEVVARLKRDLPGKATRLPRFLRVYSQRA